jgi:hypothetical protein
MSRIGCWLLLLAWGCCCAGQPQGGYVVGNFSIAAQINEADGPVSLIKTNPPQLGVWLQNFGRGELWVEGTNGSKRRLTLHPTTVSREYPEYHAVFDAEGQLQVSVDAFAPVGLSVETNFLPAIIYRVRVTAARSWKGIVGYTLQQAMNVPNAPDDDSTPWPSTSLAVLAKLEAGVFREPAFVAVAGNRSAVSLSRQGEPLSASIAVQLEAGMQETFAFLVGRFDRDGAYTRKAATPERLLHEMASGIDSLADQLHAFVEMIPRTGDGRIDHYLPWYMSAGILLTKGDRAGHVLTMGYRELNPRDSFWTSGIHLVFWKDLERLMIQEMASGQRPDGRITATVLPVIDRGDEIDSSTYFILRLARYYRWSRDEALLKQLWPAVQKAIVYLAGRDTDHVGVPKQISHWADWKDVPGVTGRTYAPYFALLWLASLREASELADALHDANSAALYRELGDRAERFINKPWDQGGLWNGRNYMDRWVDGHRPNYVLEDQVVGGYFDVIPRDRLGSLYQQLRKSETPWGVRETFPYHPKWTQDMGGTPGNYHNGGIWPSLNFVDVADRYIHGHSIEAERIIHEVGEADLDAHGDEKPGEFLNGDTGANAGFELQGWDAALFSAVYFGAFGISRPSVGQIDIRVHIPPGRDFSTRLMLPECRGTLERHAGDLVWREDQQECLKKGIAVSVRQGS